MRNIGPIVDILLGTVGNTRQDRSTGSSIALQLVGDDPEWFLALTAQQVAKEPLGCTLIAATLQQNIDDITILIHGAPKILLRPLILTKSSSRCQVSPSPRRRRTIDFHCIKKVLRNDCNLDQERSRESACQPKEASLELGPHPSVLWSNQGGRPCRVCILAFASQRVFCFSLPP